MIRSGWACLGAALALAASPAAAGEGGKPEDVLKGRGLTHVGAKFVLKEDEAAAIDQMAEVRGLARQLKASTDKEALIKEQALMIQQLDAQKNQLQAQLRAFNAQANAMSRSRYGRMASYQFSAGRNELQAELNLVNQQSTQLKSAKPSPQAKKELEAEIKSRRDEYLAGLAELRTAVDAARARYDELGDDEPIRSALNEVGRKTHANQTLGPSKEFRAAVRQLEAMEKAAKVGPASKAKHPAAKGKAKSATKGD